MLLLIYKKIYIAVVEPGFPRWGAPTLLFDKSCRLLHENESYRTDTVSKKRYESKSVYAL